MLYVKVGIMLALLAGLLAFLYARRQQLKTFFSEVQFEMGKVVWPQSDEVVNLTILVAVVTTILAVLCFFTDNIFAILLKWIL